MLAYADGVAVVFEVSDQLELFDPRIEQHRSARRKQQRRSDEQRVPDGGKNSCSKQARNQDGRSPARHGDSRRPRSARFGVKRLHGGLLLPALDFLRVFFLRAANAVGGLRQAFADVFGGRADRALHGCLELAVILRGDGLLHRVADLVADVVGCCHGCLSDAPFSEKGARVGTFYFGVILPQARYETATCLRRHGVCVTGCSARTVRSLFRSTRYGFLRSLPCCCLRYRRPTGTTDHGTCGCWC